MIRDKNPNESSMLATILDGDNAGEKALWIDKTLCWESSKNSKLKEYENEILSCGNSTIINSGSCRIFCEKIGNRQELVICGAGNVSIEVIELAKKIGFYVTVIDDRPYFADNARREGADCVVCDDFLHALDSLNGGEDTYFVIVTRGHRYDADCLRNILYKKSAYVGMMGSRRRVIMLKKQLKEEGFLVELLDSVHSPIGLSIGAQSPEEIAVSIIAEIIQVKNAKRKISAYDKEMLYYLTADKDKSPSGYAVLCTIVEKKGSAPRECGTKLLILPDNKIIGTIGGGCAEGKVLEKGRIMLSDDSGKIKPRLEIVDMTAWEVEDEGMVCGGTILVFLEKVPVYID
jgi:xanthine dehydrogenase accessory factor